MQNREELRQKGHDGSKKTTCCERGKKYYFQKGGGINIVFRPKYRPLMLHKMYCANVIGEVAAHCSEKCGKEAREQAMQQKNANFLSHPRRQ